MAEIWQAVGRVFDAVKSPFTMPLKLRPTGLGSGVDKDRPTTPSLSASGRSAASTRPVSCTHGLGVSKGNRSSPMAHFFFRRRVVAFFAGVALSIRKSSSFLPSLIAAVSHLGVAPRPAHVSPPAPRYFGATFFPFNLLPRATRATLPPTEAIEPPSAANCFSSVVRRSERAFSTCLRKVMSEAKSIRDRLILATAMLQ